MSEEKPQQQQQTVESIERSENAMIFRTRALVIENSDLLQASERIAGVVESLRGIILSLEKTKEAQREALRISHNQSDELRKHLQTLQT